MRTALTLLFFASALSVIPADPALAQFQQPSVFAGGTIFFSALLAFIAGAIVGGLLAGWRYFMEIASDRQKARTFFAIMGGIIFVGIVVGANSTNIGTLSGASLITNIVAFLTGIAAIGTVFYQPPGTLPNPFGTARFARVDELDARGWLDQYPNGKGLFLGRVGETEERDIVYQGDMHAMTVAPTRTGKGTTAIIPNLLALNSSVLVIDPKGENARRTASRRQRMGQTVHVVDPWKIATEPDRYGEGCDPGLIARYNPLDSLDPQSPDLATDVMMLADALIVPSGGDTHWDEEAKGLIFSFILYLLTDDRETSRRNLGRLRELLTLPEEPEQDPDRESLQEILARMFESSHQLVRSSAARFWQKADKERSGVLSSAQSNTHFLDSPVLQDSLSASDLSFESLKTAEHPVTVYLVLPLDRLPAFNRWLRLLVISALKDLMRIPHPGDRPPVRFILDEFAALKRLDMIREAYGTMAGLGVQLWTITQDLGQIQALYGESWQTFVGNAGVFQYFGSRDQTTAEYASKLTGMATIPKRSVSSGVASGKDGSSSNESISYDDIQRPLLFPDELMTLPRDRELLFIENGYPIIARKVQWFDDPGMRALCSGEAVPERPVRGKAVPRPANKPRPANQPKPKPEPVQGAGPTVGDGMKDKARALGETAVDLAGRGLAATEKAIERKTQINQKSGPDADDPHRKDEGDGTR